MVAAPATGRQPSTRAGFSDVCLTIIGRRKRKKPCKLVGKKRQVRRPSITSFADNNVRAKNVCDASQPRSQGWTRSQSLWPERMCVRRCDLRQTYRTSGKPHYYVSCLKTTDSDRIQVHYKRHSQ